MLAHEDSRNSWDTGVLLCRLNCTFWVLCPVTICQVSRFSLRIWNRWLRRRLMSFSNNCSSSCLNTDEVNVHGKCAWELADASGFYLKSEEPVQTRKKARQVNMCMSRNFSLQSNVVTLKNVKRTCLGIIVLGWLVFQRLFVLFVEELVMVRCKDLFRYLGHLGDSGN